MQRNLLSDMLGKQAGIGDRQGRVRLEEVDMGDRQRREQVEGVR